MTTKARYRDEAVGSSSAMCSIACIAVSGRRKNMRHTSTITSKAATPSSRASVTQGDRNRASIPAAK
jgi:hypothetical protein